MTIIVTGRVRPGLMGMLTKYFIPIDSGVFIGNPSKKVREQIFDKLSEIIEPEEFIII